MPNSHYLRYLSSLAVFVGLTLILSPALLAAEEQNGERIYRSQCASCHGAKGEGSDDYPHPLAGDRSMVKLVRYIARSMPKDSDEKCTGEDAKKVATYIYGAFYSRTARERNKPARLELSRLTVRQYRQSVADLLGTFRGSAPRDLSHGLRGEYFKSRRFRKGERAIERTDATVAFDFGVSSPDAKKLDAHQFSIRWTGALLAPETGVYDLIVRTDHAARLWLNDNKRPLIDAWVKSGSDTEHRDSIFLLGGRIYPFRLEFSKAKQGVDDSKKKKKKPDVKASISLEWQRPRRAAEVIPSWNLTTKSAPQSFVVTTPFPPDDRSVGYERGTSISKAWDQATTDAAIETADYVAAHLAELSGVRDSDAKREPRLRDFCRRFAERAFRRPLSDEQKRLYVDRPFASTADLQTAVKRVVLFVLKSPRFLYREIGGEGDAYDTAARLSFALWDSLPDTELLKAAAAGKLATREQARRQAERMLPDPRTHAKLRHFFLQWLKLDPVPELVKDKARYPNFDLAAATDLRTSLELFLEDVLWSDASDYRQLLFADYLYLNGRLSKIYGGNLAADAPFQKVTLAPGRRAGLLTHPYLMATFAYTAASSPIHRGVFLTRNVLGRTLLPPPQVNAALSVDLHPKLTTRERTALQTHTQSCQTCHGTINPLGFALENFDAIGRFRTEEIGRPIDAHGDYQTLAGQQVKFVGARGLAEFLAGSEEAQQTFVDRLFHHFIAQPIRAFGPRQRMDLRQFFADNRYNVHKLLGEIAVQSALLAGVRSKPTSEK